MLKYLLSILLFTSVGVVSAQKPIVGHIPLTKLKHIIVWSLEQLNGMLM